MLPPHKGKLYRGINVRFSEREYRTGQTVCWPAFSSASAEQTVAKEFVKGDEGSLFFIQCTGGKAIGRFSKFPDEAEVFERVDQGGDSHQPSVNHQTLTTDHANGSAAMRLAEGEGMNSLVVHLISAANRSLEESADPSNRLSTNIFVSIHRFILCHLLFFLLYVICICYLRYAIIFVIPFPEFLVWAIGLGLDFFCPLCHMDICCNTRSGALSAKFFRRRNVS